MSQGNLPTINSQVTAALTTRYRDGYRVARFINWLGSFIKVVGVIVGTVVFFVVGAPFINQRIDSPEELLPIALAAGVPAGSLILMALIFGTLLSGQGQLLMAQLDTAVSASPFLTAVDRLNAMSLLPSSLRLMGAAGTQTTSSSSVPDAVGRRCPVCSKEVPGKDGRFCEHCGAPLADS